MEIMNLAFSEDGKKVPGAKWTLVKSDRMRRRWKGLTGGFGFRGSVRSNSFSCFWVWTTSKMQVADSDPKCLPLKWGVCVCVFFFWSRVDLRCCVHFCHTAKWLMTHLYVCIYYFFFFLQHSMCDLSFPTRDQTCAPCSGSEGSLQWMVLLGLWSPKKI